jgi:hypothetical protein
LQVKNRDVEALAAAVQDLVKAEDADAPEAEEKLRTLQDNWSALKALVELRVSLALKYVNYLKVSHQVRIRARTAFGDNLQSSWSCYPLHT